MGAANLEEMLLRRERRLLSGHGRMQNNKAGLPKAGDTRSTLYYKLKALGISD